MKKPDMEARHLSELAQRLGALGERVPQHMVEQGAEQLVARMETETDDERLSELARGLAALGERLRPEIAKQSLTTIMSTTSLANPSCASAIPLARPGHLSIILDLLKWPTCSFDHRLQIIGAIEKEMGESCRTTEKERDRAKSAGKKIDFWKFLNVAECWAQANQYNLDDPPSRPDHLR
jgi:hypothetical protein